MGIPIIHIFTITDITLMAIFHSVMILMASIISAMAAALIVTLVVTSAAMRAEVALERQARGRVFSDLLWASHSRMLALGSWEADETEIGENSSPAGQGTRKK